MRLMFVQTMRAIAVARRAIPIAIVCMPLLLLEWRVAGERGVMLALVHFAAFLVIGPFIHRLLFPERDKASLLVLRALAFAVVDLTCVALLGVVLPQAIGAQNSLFADTLTLYAEVPLFWAASWALGRDIEWELRLSDAHARNQALVREAERAQLLALRAHLDPHFLFNTLNAIAEWCREDPLVAERATLQLSQMLRTMLAGVKASAWPLHDELALSRQLLELHRTRDPQRFVFEINATPEAEATSVPPMTVLSLVENAIKHGPAAGHAGAIEVKAHVVGERLQIAICNPGVYRGRREGGEGLATIDRRLELAYDQQASMKHVSDDATTTATLDLPLRLHGSAV